MSNNITQYHGDCREVLKTIPDKSVHCCVTSPPYFGLRDYGEIGQIGLEPSPEEYVNEMTMVFREVRRVLRDDGTLWLNLGDSYGTGTTAARKQGSRGLGLGTGDAQDAVPRCGGMAKQLLGIPWRVAFSLQQDGWYLRQDIIWHKPNPMPESVTDRCTKAHEYIFLMSKSARYYYDAEAIKEPLAESSIGRAGRKQSLMDRTGKGTIGKQIENGVDQKHAYAGLALGRNGKTGYDLDSGTRNRRSVWTVATQPYKGAHFATFPEKLIEPCILAGCPDGGTVIDPFGGSGTVGVVAKKNTRKSILIDSNIEYIGLQYSRIGAVL